MQNMKKSSNSHFKTSKNAIIAYILYKFMFHVKHYYDDSSAEFYILHIVLLCFGASCNIIVPQNFNIYCLLIQ